MANPFAEARWFHRVGHVTNTTPLRVLPAPRGVGVVTTQGRKTGRERKRAMRVVRDGDRAYAVAFMGRKTDWLANLRGDPNVRIKLGRRTYRARAREIVDPDERARAAEVYRPVAGWYDYVDYLTYVWSIPTRSRVLRVHDEWFERGTPVVFELADGGR
jgi:deazaflavin-dependent oxidoreductase (nitroreductase family)